MNDPDSALIHPKTHPVGWVCTMILSACKLPRLGCRSNTAGAHFDSYRVAFSDHCDRLQVWVEAAACMAVREANCIPEDWAFAARSALSHACMPPTNWIVNKRYLYAMGEQPLSLSGQPTALKQ
jgi:hypothetical protein